MPQPHDTPEQHDTAEAAGSRNGAGPCQPGAYTKRGRFWAVTDAAGRLVCLAVYKKGAQEVLRRLAATTTEPKRRAKPRRRQDERRSQERKRGKRA